MENKLNRVSELLKSIYYKPSNPGSFGGKERLYLAAKKIDASIKRKDVQDWLSGQIVYTLHKRARRRFKRNPILAERPLENFQADLIDLQEFSSQNDGFNYLLTIIDVFSKKAWAIPIKNKTKFSVATAFEKVLKNFCPFKLQTDKGKEFDNEIFRNLMKEYNINHFFAKNKEIKCAIVERFNRTLKEKMFAYFTLTGKRRFINKIEELIEAYNNSVHRTIKMAPNQVTDENAGEVFKNIYKCENKREYLRNYRKPRLMDNDDVRKRYEMKIHDRGYYPNWTDEIYKIHKRLFGKNKPYYQLKDSSGKVDEKRYYQEEIQKVKPDLYRIEKILKQRKRKGKTEVFVKWLNHPESENSWIPSSNITELNG